MPRPKSEAAAAAEEPDDFTVVTLEDAAERVAGVEFLVPGWVPRGMLTGVVAEPGVGKSAFALCGVARPVMTGGPFFNGTPNPAPPAPVLWVGTENDVAITVKRCRDWGLPFGSVLLPLPDPLGTVSLTDAAHLARIEAIIDRRRPPLVVVDSLRGGHDGDENCSRIGRVLQGLASLAERTGAAIVVVHHSKKMSAAEAIDANSSRGSNAIHAMFRAMVGVWRPDPDSPWCRVKVVKENLGVAPPEVGFRVTASGVEFGPPPEAPKKETEGDRGEAFLRGKLVPGVEQPSAPLLEAAAAEGLSESAVFRARKALGVKPRKVGNGWSWTLPLPVGKESLTPATAGPSAASGLLDFLRGETSEVLKS